MDGVWVDTAFDPETMTATRVPFLSPDYFALSASRSDIAAAFALGSRVIVVTAGNAYEVVDESAIADPVVLPPPLEPSVVGRLDPDEPQPEHEPDRGSSTGVNLPCASLGLLLGAAAILPRRRRDLHQ